jgi:hypothetical protein
MTAPYRFTIERYKKIKARKAIPVRSSMVTYASTAGKKIPKDRMVPSTANRQNPRDANAIFPALTFRKEITEMMVMTMARPAKERRRKISSSFIHGHVPEGITGAPFLYFSVKREGEE